MKQQGQRGMLHRGDHLTDRLHVRLFTAEYRVIGPEWDTRQVLSSYWRFYFNRADGAALRLHPDDPASEQEDILYPLAARTLYFVPAGVRFSCCCPVREVGHFYIHFDVLGLPVPTPFDVFRQPTRLPADPSLEAEADLLATLLKERVSRGTSDDLAIHCRLKAILYSSLARWMETLPAAQQERFLLRAAALEPVQPALDFIEAHLGEKITTTILAAACCVSEDHFLRKFRHCVGTTPGDWLQARRVQEAAQRLLFTGQSMEEIATSCGFSNRFYLTRVFTQRMGVSPAAYRRTDQPYAPIKKARRYHDDIGR